MRPFSTLAIASLFAFSGQTAFADKLNVVTSIRPIESLVKSIGKDLTSVTTLVPANGSPHNYALKPSDAKNLQNADVIFWIDEHFEGFLEKAINTLPQHATAVALAEQDGIQVLETREIDLNDDHQDEHAHEDGHDEHEGHEHGAHDLHIWLDPENAKVMSNIIAQTLSDQDPANKAAYQQNAAELIAKLDVLIASTTIQLAPVQNKSFVTFHDAYQYFENRFELKNVGVVSLNPETKPGAKRLQDLKTALAENNIACVFSEPQFDEKLVTLAVDGTNVRAAELDPLGAHLNSGTALYFDLIEQLTSNVVNCLSPAQ